MIANTTHDSAGMPLEQRQDRRQKLIHRRERAHHHRECGADDERAGKTGQNAPDWSRARR